MKRYDNRVLNKLIDRYENRSAYAADHLAYDKPVSVNALPHRRGIFFRIDRKNFPEYFDTTAGEYETIHDQLVELEERGLIQLYWRDGIKGHILEKAALEVCNVEACYKYLDRVPRWKKEGKIIEICRKFRDTSVPAYRDNADNGSIEILTGFLDWVVYRLREGESIKRYADIEDPSGFDRLCSMLSAILTNNQDVYLRQFSIQVFNDSKIAEKELEKSVSVIREFEADSDKYSSMSSDEVLECFSIYRNPVWMHLKGNAAIRFDSEDSMNDRPVCLRLLENGIGVTLHDLNLIEPDPANPPECVMTVENLTSYYQQETSISGMKALIIYIGGFTGRQGRSFLMKLRKAYPYARFIHSGDIDCGGFRIWKSLCTGTGIPFETYRMNIETFRQFAANGRALTDKDRKDLEAMKNDPFFSDQIELFDLMLETGLKLEQECFV